MTRGSSPTIDRIIDWPLLVAGGLALLPAVGPLSREWQINSNCGHVWLALPAAVVVLFVHLRYGRRPDLPPPAPRHPGRWRIGDMLGLAMLMAASLAAWAYASIRDPMFLAVCLWLGLVGVIALLGSVGALRRAGWALALLALCIPPPQSITKNIVHLKLQQLTADAAGGLAGAFAIPLRVEQTTVWLGDQSLVVAEPCSGFRFLIALGFAAMLIAALGPGRRLLSAIFLLPSALIIALAANVLRIGAAIVIMHHSSAATAKAFLHGPGVWVVYLLGTGLLMLIARTIHETAELSASSQDAWRTEPCHGATAWC